MFIKVYRLEIQSDMLVFREHSFVNCYPSPLFSGSTLPLPLCEKYTVYTYTVCKRGIWGSGPQTVKHLPQSPFTGQFFRWRHFALPSMSLIFLYDSFKAGLRTGCASFINCLSWLWLKTLLCTDIAASRPCSCRKRDRHENLDPPFTYLW